MIIKELRLFRVLGCENVHLKFPENDNELHSCVYVVQSSEKCDIISLAVQLIYSQKYADLSSLYPLLDRLNGGQIGIRFQLPSADAHLSSDSDSDQPCTSRHARERSMRRRNRRIARRSGFILDATRDFYSNPETIVFSVNDGDLHELTVTQFQTHFFSCTEILLPRMSNLSYFDYKSGKWVDLLFNKNSQTNKGDNVLKEFCEVYRCHKDQITNILSRMTTSIIEVRTSFEMSLTAHILRMFDDIRQVFEYITFSDYTAWFLFKKDPYLSEKFSFDDLQTYVQLRTANEDNPRIPWHTAEIHIQELLLVAIQLGFAYHCKQDMVFLQNLESVRIQETLEIFNAALILDTEYYKKTWQTKKYIQRIVDVCNKIGITAILEVNGNIVCSIRPVNFIKCHRPKNSTEWNMVVKSDIGVSDHSLENFSKIIYKAFH